MKITRNGIEYELTAEELRKAYEEQEAEYEKADLLYRLEDYEITNVSEQQIGKMMQMFDKRLHRDDYYCEIYWEVMDAIIEEVMEVSYDD